MKTKRATTIVVLALFTLMLSFSPTAASAVGGLAEPVPEFNQAVAGTPPADLICVSVTGATACYRESSDNWWVRDTVADSASAEVAWSNYRNGVLYRSGICRNSMGSGTWRVCYKDYLENSPLIFYACVYDASEGEYIRCSSNPATAAA